jgi:phage-related protein
VKGNSMAETLTRLRTWFEENRGPITQFVDGTFGKLATKAVEVGESIRDFALEQFQKVSAWVAENRPLIDEFGNVLGNLALGFIRVSTGGQSALLGLWAVVSPLLGGLVDLVLNIAKAIMQMATGDWAGAWETIKERPRLAWEALKQSFRAFLDWVTGWFGTDWASVTEQWRGNWELAKEILRLAWEAMQQKVTEIWTAVKTFILTKLTELFAAMGLDLDAMALRWSTIWSDVQLIAETIWGKIYTFISKSVNDIKAWIEEKIQALQDWWGPKWDAISGTLSKTWEAMKSAVTKKVKEVYTAVTDKIEEIRTWIDGKINDFYNIGANIMNSLKDGALSAAGDLIDSVTGAIEDALEAARRLLGIGGTYSGTEFQTALNTAQRYAGLLNNGSGAAEKFTRPTAAATPPRGAEVFHIYGNVIVEQGAGKEDMLRDLRQARRQR